jgi:hypothetical protein
MELPRTTLSLLQDDAYASLCREAVTQSLAALESEKAVVATTRPPFGGMLARKETREKFDRSMRRVLGTEAALRDRLSRLDAVNAVLQPLLRRGVSDYLAQVSPEYCRNLQLLARLGDWEIAYQALPELLLGFARDLRGLRLAATGAPNLRSCLYELATLRDMASRLERHAREISIIGQAIAETASADAFSDVTVPALPDFQRLPWVSRLASLSPAQVVTETAAAEAEIRRFLAAGAETELARIEASRDAARRRADHFVERYTAQLQAHARTHYVEERDVDPVLGQLYRDYVEAGIEERQQALFDPLIER